MAEPFTSYEVDNDRRFRNALKRAADTFQDLRVPFGLILSDFYKSQQSIFQLKGPGRYPPFKVSKKIVGGRVTTESAYQRRKLEKYGFDYPLLVASGKLAASLLGPNNTGSIAKVTPLSLTIGTSIEHGIYHQSDLPRRKIPLRKFLFIGPEAPQFATSQTQGRPERWLNIMNDFVLRKMRTEVGA